MCCGVSLSKASLSFSLSLPIRNSPAGMVTQSKAIGPAAGARGCVGVWRLRCDLGRLDDRDARHRAGERGQPGVPRVVRLRFGNQLRDPPRTLGPGDQVEDHLRQVAAAGDQIQVLVQLEAHHLPQAALVVGVQQAGHQLLHLRAGKTERRCGDLDASQPVSHSVSARLLVYLFPCLPVSPVSPSPASGPLSSLPTYGAARPGPPRSGPETGRAGRRSTAWAHCMPRRPTG